MANLRNILLILHVCCIDNFLVHGACQCSGVVGKRQSQSAADSIFTSLAGDDLVEILHTFRLLGREADIIACRVLESETSSKEGGSESRNSTARRSEIAPSPDFAKWERRLPFCCLALFDNLISGASQPRPIGGEPRNIRCSGLEEDFLCDCYGRDGT